MNTQEECKELLMQDVVRIDIMPEETLKVSVPFNLQDVAEAVVRMSDDTALTDAKLFTDSLLSLNLNGDALADAEMQEGLTHKPTERRESAGIIRTHTLQAGIETGFDVIRTKEHALQENDFHIVLTTEDGTRYLAYGLPNTSQFSIDEQMGSSAKMTVKVTLQSMSGFIVINNV